MDSQSLRWAKRGFYERKAGTLISWEQRNDPLGGRVCRCAPALLIGPCLGGDATDSSELENERRCPPCSPSLAGGCVTALRVFYCPGPPIPSVTVFKPQQGGSLQQRLASESAVMRLEQRILTIEAEQEALLSSMGEEVDAACSSLLKNSPSNPKVFMSCSCTYLCILVLFS